ncbi:MAG: transposase [Saprospirales bacterium]|nr:transposase [Saprospirales bacterium]
MVLSDAEKIVRTGLVYAKCPKRCIRLVAVDYLREDGSSFTRKLYFCTDSEQDALWILERYQCRFQIEFLFRDAKQFTGLTQCQSTNQAKIENHVNLALSAVSMAKAAHWLPLDKEQRGLFSMTELKNYYYNLALVERFSIALGLNPTETKNNPKIKELLFSSSYAALAA